MPLKQVYECSNHSSSAYALVLAQSSKLVAHNWMMWVRVPPGVLKEMNKKELEIALQPKKEELITLAKHCNGKLDRFVEIFEKLVDVCDLVGKYTASHPEDKEAQDFLDRTIKSLVTFVNNLDDDDCDDSEFGLGGDWWKG